MSNLKAKEKIGAMDRRITVQSSTASADGYGDVTESWSTLYTTWANVANTSGTEPVEAGKETSIRNTFFTIRHNSTTTATSEKNRVVYASKTYEIISVFEMPDARLRFLKLETRLIQ